MKTVNLTPWCNLFSTASKYNITVNKPHYKVIVYLGVVLILALLLLTFFTYAYHLALTVAVVSTILLGFLLTKQSRQQVIISTFELTEQGQCLFKDGSNYQLHLSSRCSFLGCWLVLQPLVTAGIFPVVKINNGKELFFIYRDSLSKQDFSRIANVISQLHYQG